MNLSELGEQSFNFAFELGYYQDLDNLNHGIVLLGIASEVFEAYQDLRRERYGDMRAELADVLIRVMSYAHVMGFDMEKQVKLNMVEKKGNGHKPY